jgi:hypothetical protein
MEMIESRNMTSHTYNEDITKKIVLNIKDKYYQEFINIEQKLLKLL